MGSNKHVNWPVSSTVPIEWICSIFSTQPVLLSHKVAWDIGPVAEREEILPIERFIRKDDVTSTAVTANVDFVSYKSAVLRQANKLFASITNQPCCSGHLNSLRM